MQVSVKRHKNLIFLVAMITYASANNIGVFVPLFYHLKFSEFDSDFTTFLVMIYLLVFCPKISTSPCWETSWEKYIFIYCRCLFRIGMYYPDWKIHSFDMLWAVLAREKNYEDSTCRYNQQNVTTARTT